jgi:hypothetical protein
MTTKHQLYHGDLCATGELMRKAIAAYMAENGKQCSVLILWDSELQTETLGYGEPGTIFESIVSMFIDEVVPASADMFVDKMEMQGRLEEVAERFKSCDCDHCKKRRDDEGGDR